MTQFEPEVGSPVRRVFGIEAPPEAVVLASSRSIGEAVAQLARDIQPWIDAPGGDPVVLVPLLQGGKFYADQLEQALRLLCSSQFERNDLTVSTRMDDGTPLTSPSVAGKMEVLRGRRVLIVDDILDSGATLSVINAALQSIVGELKTTVLVQKDSPTGLDPNRPVADYVGLSFADSRWYTGCGMDMPGDPEQNARALPYIIAYPPLFSVASEDELAATTF